MNSPVTPEDLHTLNDALRLENERLTRALEQACEHGAIYEPKEWAFGARETNSVDDVLFFDEYGEMRLEECPELAAHLRAREAKG